MLIKTVSDRFVALKQEESVKKKSYLYDIMHEGNVVYKGLTANIPASGKNPVEVRFDQHID